MATSPCPRCGAPSGGGPACLECGAGLRVGAGEPAAPVVLSPVRGGGDVLWARVALVGTVVVTVAMAAMVLVMTIRGLHLPR